MKKNIILTAFAVSLCSLVSANEEPPTEINNPHRLNFGLDVLWENNSERIEWLKVKSHTFLRGVRVGYDFQKPNAIYGGIQGLAAFGWTNINLNADYPFFSYRYSVDSFLGNLEGRVGYTFQPLKNVLLIPFGGLGDYYLQSAQHNLKVEQNWLYAAAGLRSNFALNSRFSLGVNLKGMCPFHAQQQIKEYHTTISNTPDTNTWGYEIGLPITWTISKKIKNWEVQLEPYVLKLNTTSAGTIFGYRYTLAHWF